MVPSVSGNICSHVGESANIPQVLPFGKVGVARKDIEESARLQQEGGTGVGEQFVDWLDQQVVTFT